ncbi:MAG: hypothetical protein FJW83_01585 [Actinobacteria bacterium]|nr:hypothetical protein [Actinomycetota bacterium]
MSALPPLRLLLRSESGRRFFRYCVVSGWNVVFGQILLFGVHLWVERPGAANVIAVVAGLGPAYLVSRRFVWEATGSHSVTGEMLPFLGLTVLGTITSTVAVEIAGAVTDVRIAVNLASLSAWFGVWVVKYVLLDRIIYRRRNALVAH